MSRVPIFETIIICTLLGLLSWPLANLTGRAKEDISSNEENVVSESSLNDDYPFLIKVYGSEKLSSIRFSFSDGSHISSGEISTREWELERKLPLVNGILEFSVEASFVDEEEDEALKIELWPLALPEKSFTYWGAGDIFEEVVAEWEVAE